MILWSNAPLLYRPIADIFSQIRELPSQPGNRILDHEYFVVIPRSFFSLQVRENPPYPGHLRLDYDDFVVLPISVSDWSFRVRDK